jgi:hypothetical protein
MYSQFLFRSFLSFPLFFLSVSLCISLSYCLVFIVFIFLQFFYTFLSVSIVVLKQCSFYELLTHVCCRVAGLTLTLSFIVCNN